VQTKGLYVRMSEAEHKRLRVAAAERGRRIAELVREAITRYLDETEVDNG
jgi:predicted DNA-binding protein